MNEKLVEYSKKLKLGKKFLDEYDQIPFTTREEYLEKIFEIALNYRKINAKNRLLKQARFYILKTFDDYDFSEVDFPETIGIEEIQELEFVLRQEI